MEASATESSLLSGPRIDVVIIDDHPLVRLGMSTLINHQPDQRVVASVGWGPGVPPALHRLQQGVLVLDLPRTDARAWEVVRSLQADRTDVRLLVVASDETPENIRQAVAAGALGFLFKRAAEEELVEAIREVHAGRTYLPAAVAARLRESRPAGRLTPREQETLDLLGKGLRNRELGAVLGISEQTVKTHLKSLFRKLEVADRAEAVREGFCRGIIVAG